VSEIRTHTYQQDPEISDWRGRRPCATCGMPLQHGSHDVPEQPPEVAEINARILGESRE
jgi:hypothetical protein